MCSRVRDHLWAFWSQSTPSSPVTHIPVIICGQVIDFKSPESKYPNCSRLGILGAMTCHRRNFSHLTPWAGFVVTMQWLSTWQDLKSPMRQEITHRNTLERAFAFRLAEMGRATPDVDGTFSGDQVWGGKSTAILPPQPPKWKPTPTSDKPRHVHRVMQCASSGHHLVALCGGYKLPPQLCQGQYKSKEDLFFRLHSTLLHPDYTSLLALCGYKLAL